MSSGASGLLPALNDVAAQAEAAIDAGYQFIVISDKAMGPQRAPIPSLLATGAVHHHLVDVKKRSRLGLIIETGEVS